MEPINILLVLVFCRVGACVQVLTCKHCVCPAVTITELLDDDLVRPKHVGGVLLRFDCDLRRLCT